MSTPLAPAALSGMTRTRRTRPAGADGRAITASNCVCCLRVTRTRRVVCATHRIDHMLDAISTAAHQRELCGTIGPVGQEGVPVKKETLSAEQITAVWQRVGRRALLSRVHRGRPRAASQTPVAARHGGASRAAAAGDPRATRFGARPLSRTNWPMAADSRRSRFSTCLRANAWRSTSAVDSAATTSNLNQRDGMNLAISRALSPLSVPPFARYANALSYS
jgi:hypothetical protein